MRGMVWCVHDEKQTAKNGESSRHNNAVNLEQNRYNRDTVAASLHRLFDALPSNRPAATTKITRQALDLVVSLRHRFRPILFLPTPGLPTSITKSRHGKKKKVVFVVVYLYLPPFPPRLLLIRLRITPSTLLSDVETLRTKAHFVCLYELPAQVFAIMDNTVVSGLRRRGEKKKKKKGKGESVVGVEVKPTKMPSALGCMANAHHRQRLKKSSVVISDIGGKV